MKLDPVSLKLFIEIVETGTIGGGAGRLNIVTSAASKRIAEMESALQTQLLRRTNRGVEPTAAGAELARLARRVVGDLEDIARQVRDFSKGVRGHVRMVVSASALCQSLPTDLAAFIAAYPDVYVHLEERSSDAVLKAVAENAADIGITFPMPHTFPMLDTYGVEDIPYQEYQLVVLAPRGHALGRRRSVKFVDTLDHQHIGLRASSPTNTYMSRRAGDLDRSINYRVFVESYHAMALLVQAGLGIAVVPDGVLQPFSKTFGIVALPLDEDWATRELRIFFASSARQQSASRLLAAHLGGLKR